MVHHQIVHLSAKPYGAHLITEELLEHIELQDSGLLHIFIQHTSAALALNENASADVLSDVTHFFHQLVPEGTHYKHREEGVDDMPAHIKSILCGSALTIPFQNQKLLLGIWQGIYLMEFRYKAGPRTLVLSQLI